MIPRETVPTLSLSFLEGLYADYLRDPASVSADWQEYFARWAEEEKPLTPFQTIPRFRQQSIFHSPPNGAHRGFSEEETAAIGLQDRVDQILRAYRTRGHMISQIDPLGMARPTPPELDPQFYGFTESDLDRLFSCETLHEGGPLTLREILERLRNTYCRWIGVEYMHIDDLAIRRWMQRRMERTENRFQISREVQRRILARLTDAVTFEEFIRKKFIGAKSFSLEGSESLIPLLDLAIEKAGGQGIREIVIGMAHRGRLNVLANILGKSPRQVFREFADADPELYTGRGDVKYHLGHHGRWRTAEGVTIELSMCFNPSHLEFVNPVALGRMRAKQDRAGDLQREQGLVLLIHGDAAFAGEGIVQETLNLSQLPGFAVGGTLHVLVNNQIGFTTAPEEGRSSTYATDVGKMLQIPIFHVNGEDPEAVAQVVEICMDFRKQFKRDVIIDMYGYRKLGHNEGDEPTFTQPVLYRAIQKRKPVRESYVEHLLQLGGLTREEADQIVEKRRAFLEQELSESRSESYRPPKKQLRGIWSDYVGGPDAQAPEPDTGVDERKLRELLAKLAHVPPDFHLHPKLGRFFEARRAMAEGKQPLDWSAGETLALASLAAEGFRIRFSGQDAGRGTFSQRHAVLHDYEDGAVFVPLQHVAANQAPVDIYNSPLSEAGVLGFEYGYSVDCPDGLILWEAQFGDFWNAAQVIVDQFIASAEDKWHRLSGLVLLLPHGFEGQGPEHSSARLERFLNLVAEDNMQIVYPTTPAQFFHCLRRQVVRRWRKPLVVMTPKSLLRHPRAVSNIEECARGRFARILPDAPENSDAPLSKIILCSGKVFYDLDEHRRHFRRRDVALIRLEQLYPFRIDELHSVLAPYRDGTPVVWVQEEPENMGAWRYLRVLFGHTILGRFPFSGVFRPASASPATGSANSHKREQETVLLDAFGKS